MSMHRVLRCSVLVLVASVAGCATNEPVPQGYVGPTASISDGVQPRTESLANAYALVEVDGRTVANVLGASAQASQGQGFKLTARAVDRNVPAGPLKLKLRAQPITGAPIQAMAMQMGGTFYTVEGVVNFTAQAGGRYVVRGELKKDVAAVWLEDADTGKILTEKVVKQP